MVLVTQKKRPAPTSYKKRSGHHHKHSTDYRKAYWPYLPMGIIVALGVVVNMFWGTIQHSVLSYATEMSVSNLLQETNNQRVAAGLGGLTLNAQLNQAAQAKANDMANRDYWSHNTPDGDAPWVFFTAAGYNYQTAGENLAYGFDSSSATVAGWMNSPGHKANILNTSYKDVGFGVASSPNYQGTGPETIVVAEYGSLQAGAAAPVSQPSTPAVSQPKPATATPTPVAEQTPTPVQQETNATPAPTKQGQPAKNNTPVVASREVSRIQLLSGSNAPWSMFAVSAIATVCVAIFLLRHGLLLRRVLLKSEAFIHHHPVFDIVLVAIATIGVVLTRTSGIIR